ncbi:hypothetical protein HY485_04960 [Candidatus Woesearchaeota archaeon]|nr:hypothetical protein [Candidatus Woesearchaeota archaeon]
MKKSVELVLLLLLLSYLVIAEEGPGGYSEEAGGLNQKLSDAIAASQPTNLVTSNDIAPSTASGDFEIPAGSSVTVNNKGDLTSSYLTSATTKSGLTIKDASDATISKNGDVAFASAEQLILNDVTIINPKNFQYNHEKQLISFNSADRLTKSLIVLTSLKETTLQSSVITTNTEQKQVFKSTIPEGVVEISPKKDSQIIIDLSNNKAKYSLKKASLTIKNNQQKPLLTADSAETQTIEITQTDDGYITRAENSIITISTNQIDERFIGSETLFEWNVENGVTKAILQSPGTYRYTYKELQIDRNGIYARADKSFAQSYEIQRPQNQQPYTLFIDKKGSPQPALDTNSAYLSLPNHLLILNGIINYNRINFDLKTIQRFMGGTWWMEVLPADGSFLPIVETNADGTTSISLDNNNVKANISTTSNDYTAYFDDVAIKNNNQELTRQWATAPFILDTLTVSPTLLFKNIPNDSWTVTQFINALPVAEFHSKQDDRKKLFEKTINNYKEAQCDNLNTKLSIDYEIVKQLIEAFT